MDSRLIGNAAEQPRRSTPGSIGPETLAAVVAGAESSNIFNNIIINLRIVAERRPSLTYRGLPDARGVANQYGLKVKAKAVCGRFNLPGYSWSRGVWQIFIKRTWSLRGSPGHDNCGRLRAHVIYVPAECEWSHQHVMIDAIEHTLDFQQRLVI